MASVQRWGQPFCGVRRPKRLPLVASPLFHNCSIPIGPKTGCLNVDEQLQAKLTPSVSRKAQCVQGEIGFSATPASRDPGVLPSDQFTDLSPMAARRGASVVHVLRRSPAYRSHWRGYPVAVGGTPAVWGRTSATDGDVQKVTSRAQLARRLPLSEPRFPVT